MMKQTEINLKKSRNEPASKAISEILKEFPDAPTRMLAGMLMKRHPKLFTDYDCARSSLRYRRGALGKYNRRARLLEAPITPRIELPASDERVFGPFVMDGCKRVLVLSDIHIPYHTKSVIEIAVAEGKRRNVDGILLNGDVLDFHQMSDFIRDPEARNFKEERRLGTQFLGYLRQEFPKARIVFKEGNHDERVKRFVLQKAPELYDETILGLPALLHFDRYGVEHVGDRRAVMLGGLTTLHGHEFAKGITAPAAPARTAYLKAGVSVLIGHHHTTNEYTKTILGGKIITCWSTGCLSDLHPHYSPYAGYNYGFANVDLDLMDFHVTNHRIHRGMLLN